ASLGGIGVGPPLAGAFHAATTRRLAEYAALIETVFAQARDRREWRELAWTDDETGLRNRRHLDAALDELLARAKAERAQLTIFLVAIDPLGEWEERVGAAADAARLHDAAGALRRCTRARDVIARYDERALALVWWEAEPPRVPGSRHPTNAAPLAQRFTA